MVGAFGRVLIVFAFFSLAGGHWAVLHSVAWAQMIREYSEEGSLIEAIARTFGNEDPCHVCESAIEDHDSDTPRAPGWRAEKKTDYSSLVTDALLREPCREPHSFPAVSDIFYLPRTDEPPWPVPRLS